MQTLGRPLVAACLMCLPGLVSAQETYQYTRSSTFTQRGDTVWWIRPFPAGDSVRARMESSSKPAVAAKSRMDTIVYVLLKDSVMMLKPMRQTLPPAAAKHFRNILVEAKADKKLQEKLKASGRPSPRPRPAPTLE